MKAFFPSTGNVFLNEFCIPPIGDDTVALLESFFLLAETVTDMSGNQFFKERT